MRYWFETLNDALESENLVDYWPLGVNIEYDRTVAFASNGKWISVYRDNNGRYERPIHYSTKMQNTY